jgi:hypothetical protein
MRIGTERLMDAITALLAEIRGEQPPTQRFVWKRTSKGEQ